MVLSIFKSTSIKKGSNIPSPDSKIRKLEYTVAIGNISRWIGNWFKRDDPDRIDAADSFREDEKKNHGSIPLKTKHVKFGLSVLNMFVKTKLITSASNIGFKTDQPKPSLDPIYLFVRLFITRLFNEPLL